MRKIINDATSNGPTVRYESSVEGGGEKDQ